MATAPMFASVSEAMDTVRAGLAFAAAADATGLTAAEQADVLRGLEQANSVATAARTSTLGAFTTGRGYSADADYSPRAWLMHKTGITKGAAVSCTMWVKWAGQHPEIFAALAAGEMSESYARTLCTGTDKLPADKRDEADKVVAAEAKAGMGLRDLAELAAELLARCRPDEPDQDLGQDFDDRSVKVQTTFQGAGIIHGDLTPSAPASSARSWTHWLAWPGPRTSGLRSSGTTTNCRKRCAGWSRRGCCRSGPGSRSRPWSAFPWPRPAPRFPA